MSIYIYDFNVADGGHIGEFSGVTKRKGKIYTLN